MLAGSPRLTEAPIEDIAGGCQGEMSIVGYDSGS